MKSELIRRLLIIIILIFYGETAHYHVKVWQPPIDTTNLTQPVRFWELVEWRPVSDQPTTTTTTEATTTTTQPPPPPPPTPSPCDFSDPELLLKRMKDSGAYNEIYMAPDFYTAAEKFPDLSGKSFSRPKSKYSCDEHCERSSQLVRMVMTGSSGERPTPRDPPRTWWDQSKWEPARNKRSLTPAPSSRRKYLEAQIRSALNELNSLEEVESPSEKRTKRSVLGDLLQSNSGNARDIVGKTIAIECKRRQETGDWSKEGYQFCQTCRAVRHLPKTYFPRILNEVICAETSCVKGDGKCAQRFLPFRVLRNDGTESCPRWRMVSVDIRTCCDCVVHPYSPFVRYLEGN